jgi:hypothetical protein
MLHSRNSDHLEASVCAMSLGSDKRECWRCSYAAHKSDECRARNWRRYVCGSLGHVTVCKKRLLKIIVVNILSSQSLAVPLVIVEGKIIATNVMNHVAMTPSRGTDEDHNGTEPVLSEMPILPGATAVNTMTWVADATKTRQGTGIELKEYHPGMSDNPERMMAEEEA